MKTLNKILIIVATLFLIIGIVGVIYGFYLNNWSTVGLLTYETVEGNFTSEQEVNNLDIKLIDSSLKIKKGEKLYVDYITRKDNPLVISLANGVLEISQNTSWWLGLKIGLNLETENLMTSITLPEKLYKECGIDITNGSATIEDLSSNSLMFESNNGSISLTDANIGDAVSLETNNGSITLSKITAKSLDADTTNGKINCDSLDIEDLLKIKSTNGSLQVNNSIANEIIMETTNGEIKGKTDVKNLTAKTTNGSINLKIYGNKDNYNIYTKKGSNENYYPSTNTNPYGKIDIRTTNGKLLLEWLLK